MSNRELLHGLEAIDTTLKASQMLSADVKEAEWFDEQVALVLKELCCNNPSLLHSKAVSNSASEEAAVIGECRLSIGGRYAICETLRQHLPSLVTGDQMVVPVGIDFKRSFAAVIEVESDLDSASVLAQYLLLEALKKNTAMSMRCVDMVKGGSFFSVAHNLVSKFPSKTSGKVYKTMMEIDPLLNDLEKEASATIAALGHKYTTVSEYNQQNAVRLPEYVHVIHLDSSSYAMDVVRRLKVLVDNRLKNGMNVIVVGEREAVRAFAELSDYYIRFRGGAAYLGESGVLPLTLSDDIRLEEDATTKLEEKMEESEFVDTVFGNRPELRTECLTMDSTKVLRIPYALDKHQQIQYFEIGGEAPAHALMSGSTGCGKSVALHTLIMQIVHNYHPDDVEIWAIDYKAVEFDWYVTHRSPHFRVVAHDTSPEFSLSLLDLLYEEYEDRMNKFLESGVKNISEYRKKHGPHSMPRIVVFIDEFQIMTQAVQNYTGDKDYRTVLENLLRLTRAMGISFMLCSQTIAAGLSGLTESARDQIGCRICLKHTDDNEIRETLKLSGPDAGEIVARAKNLRKGQGIYKRARWAKEVSPDGKAYEFKHQYILYISDDIKDEMIQEVNRRIGDDFVPKKLIFVRGGGRILVSEKYRHPMEQFLRGEYEAAEECVEWYPAAPTTLADAFCIKLENNAGANMLMVGENDDLRDSVVMHSLYGFLMDPLNRVIVNIVDESNTDRKRLIEKIAQLSCDRLTLNVGVKAVMPVICSLKKIRPNPQTKTIYVWYGLDKIKNELFLLTQEEEEAAAAETAPQVEQSSRESALLDMFGSIKAAGVDITMPVDPLQAARQEALAALDGFKPTSAKSEDSSADTPMLTNDECVKILSQAFEVGPENNHFHMTLFNNLKVLTKCGMVKLSHFEYRIGTKMSGNDSYDLFGSSSAINKANDQTVLYYAGSGLPVPLRPYLLPEQEWVDRFNQCLTDL